MAGLGIIAFEIVDEFSDEIGRRLAEARDAAGLTVDDIIFRTRIPRGVIFALEAGDFTFFSSTTYAKSFLSQYSSYLGVDATRWLDALQPAYFIADGKVGPFFSSTDPDEERPVRDFGNTSNWISTFALFALSAGLVFAAVKGFEYFDARFAAEESGPAGLKRESPVVAQPHTVPVGDSQAGEDVAPSPGLSEGTPSKPPPRALIIRESDF